MEKVQAVLDVSFASIVRFFIVLTTVVLLFFIREALIWFLFALIISILINPFVDFLELKKLSRVLGTSIIYILLIGILVLVVGVTVPNLVREIGQGIPQYLPRLEEGLREIGIEKPQIFQYDFQNITNWEDIAATALTVFEYLFKGIWALAIIVPLSFFLCMEKNKIKDFIAFIFPKKKEMITYVFDVSQRKVHLWFGTRVLNSLLMALFMYPILLIAGVYFPLTFAILIGLLSFVPFLGVVFISVILLSFISIVHTIGLAVTIFIVFHIVNIIVDYIATPILSGKILDVSPTLILMAIVIGSYLYGILGALLVIPIFAIVHEFIKNYVLENRTEQAGEKKKRVIII